MTIEQRLECLERRAKRYRNALVMLVMSVCSVGDSCGRGVSAQGKHR